jgi:signal transduction histidine kinase
VGVPSRVGAGTAVIGRLRVDRSPGHRAYQRPRSDGLVVLATIVLLAATTIVTLLLPGLSFAIVAPSADLVVNSVAMAIAGGVAALAWIRFREARQTHELFQASAFLALAVGGLITLALTVTGLGDRYGFSLGSPGQAPFYLWDLQRLTAGLLFVIGGWVGQRDEDSPIRRPFLVLLGPTGLLILLSGLVLVIQDGLPEARSPEQIALLASGPQVIDSGQLNPVVGLIELGIGLLFVVAAILFRRTHLRLGQRALAYLVLGLMVAATTQIHSIFVPTSYSGVVTSVDLFRVMFYAILLLGVATGARGDFRTLRRASDEMRALRDADVRAAELQERSRLAREMHDGLIQDLWLARLKAGHLRDVPGMPRDGELLAGQLDGALEAALAEAREALASLAPAERSSGSLAGPLTRLVEQMAERLEPELQVAIAPDLPAVPSRVELELLRIVREALMNAERHADATLIRVTGTSEGGRVRLAVVDNGVGFDTRARVPGYGLRSMSERASLIGARLTIESRPHDGTRVEVELPIGPGDNGRADGRPAPRDAQMVPATALGTEP